MWSEDEFLPISALQHWAFCPRQAALIHVERVWQDNQLTAEGSVLHRRVDLGRADTRAGRRRQRSVPVRSCRLGLFGVCDLVESDGARWWPIEYKRGRPKPFDADEVQLAAQAMCLEEMLSTKIEWGELYYGRTRRRVLVEVGAGLRSRVESVATEFRDCLRRQYTPPPVADARCERCSLRDACFPAATRDVERWFEGRVSFLAQDAPKDSEGGE